MVPVETVIRRVCRDMTLAAAMRVVGRVPTGQGDEGAVDTC